MDIYRVSFIGHHELYGLMQIEKQLEEIIIKLLCHHEYVEFYVGRNGDFDISVASAIKRAQKSQGHPNSSLILVLPYPMKNQEDYEKFYDEVIIPIESKTHPKAAITKRNQWLMDHSELLIAYVEDGRKGGAYTAMKYAESRGEPILNLAEGI